MLTEKELQEVLPVTCKIDQELMDNINNTISDPELHEQFKENLINFTTVLQQGKYKIGDYVNAVRYATFKLLGDENKDAYRKTFPDKWNNFMAEGVPDKTVAAYVAMYHKRKLVQGILAQTLTPVYILNAPALQEAINHSLTLMYTAKSEKVQQAAADSLMNHLKRPEIQKAQVEVTMNHQGNYIDSMEAAMLKMVERQRELIQQGADVKAIANAPIQDKDVIEAEII